MKQTIAGVLILTIALSLIVACEGFRQRGDHGTDDPIPIAEVDPNQTTVNIFDLVGSEEATVAGFQTESQSNLAYTFSSTPARPGQKQEGESVATRAIYASGRVAVQDQAYPQAISLWPAPPPPSTGGENPVNGLEHDAMFFEHHGVNPFIDTDLDALLTFGLDVDTASYTLARRFLQEGTMPPEAAVRVEEFINYFDWSLAVPEEDDFAIHVDGAPSRFGTDRHHLLRVGIQGRDVAAVDRPDANITFVIDTSGSMGRENRLGLVKRSLHLLIDSLRPSDQIAIVEYGSRGRLIMPHTTVRHRAEIIDAIDSLQTNGSTNAEEGLVIGYREAGRMFNERKINHVILCSDGVANVGETGADGILARIANEADRGITLTTVGFGMDNFNDVLMERLANEGDGRYAYVDTLDEARRIFVEETTGTLQIIAREARAQIVFDPTVVRSYRLLGYENRDIADDRFRDDTVDAGEIGAGHTVTVLVEVRLWEGAEEALGEVQLRYGLPGTDDFKELAHPITVADIAPSFANAAPEFRLAACVAETAEVLRGSVWARERDLEEVLAEAQTAIAEIGTSDTDLMEFLNLLARARDLQDRGVAAGTGG